MSWISFSLFCLLIGSISCRSVGKTAVNEEEIKQLVVDYIDKTEGQIKAHSPIKIGELAGINYKNEEKKVDIAVSITNGEITMDLEPKNVNVRLTSNELAIDTSVLYKNVKLVADITVVGIVDGKHIQDSGKVEATIPEIETETIANFKFDEKSVQITKLANNYPLQSPNVKLSGLSVSDEQRAYGEAALSKKFTSDLAKLDKIYKDYLPKTEQYINALLEGKTLDEVIKFIEEFVHHDSLGDHIGQHISHFFM